MTADDPFVLVDYIAGDRLQHLQQLYQETWWASHRTLPDIARMLQHTDFVFGLCEGQTQTLVGFARVLSDRTYRATIWDVMVASAYRGRGLGRRLLEAIVNHPELREVESMQLGCLADMVDFYSQFGFTDTTGSTVTMRRGR